MYFYFPLNTTVVLDDLNVNPHRYHISNVTQHNCNGFYISLYRHKKECQIYLLTFSLAKHIAIMLSLLFLYFFVVNIINTFICSSFGLFHTHTINENFYVIEIENIKIEARFTHDAK